MTVVARRLPLLALLALAIAANRAACGATMDARLERHVRVRCVRAPVSLLLRKLSAETRVELSADPAVGDEPLVAFVPNAGLVDVMRSLATLFRGRWERTGSPEHPAYRLGKDLATRNEEKRARQKELDAGLDRIMRQMDRMRAERHPSEADRDAIRTVLPGLLRSRGAELLNNGGLSVPLSSLPAGEQAALVPHLQPVLDAVNADVRAAWKRRMEIVAAGGKPDPDSPAEDPGPPTSAQTCRLLIDVRQDVGLELSVHLTTEQPGDYNVHTVLEEQDPAEGEAGEALARTAVPTGLPAARSGSLPDDILQFRPEDKGAVDWAGELARLSAVARVPIYADAYSQLWHRREPPREAPVGMTFPQAMDRLCAGASPQERVRFWWPAGGAALVRSRRWLWYDPTVLPAELTERLAASVRARHAPLPDDVLRLARLPLAQVRGLFSAPQAPDAWRWGVVLPSRLSLHARELLTGTGLREDRLSSEDRLALRTLLGEAGTDESSAYEARLTGFPAREPGDLAEHMVLQLRGHAGKRTFFVAGTLPGLTDAVVVTPLDEPPAGTPQGASRPRPGASPVSR